MKLLVSKNNIDKKFQMNLIKLLNKYMKFQVQLSLFVMKIFNKISQLRDLLSRTMTKNFSKNQYRNRLKLTKQKIQREVSRCRVRLQLIMMKNRSKSENRDLLSQTMTMNCSNNNQLDPLILLKKKIYNQDSRTDVLVLMKIIKIKSQIIFCPK